MSSVLLEEDVRDMVRMLGVALSGDGDISEKRARVLRGLGKLINAHSWIWSVMAEEDPVGPPKNTVMIKEGFSDEQFVTYLRTQEHPEMGLLVNSFINDVRDHSKRITRTRTQIMNPGEIDSLSVGQLFLEAGIRATLISGQFTQSGGMSSIVFFRRPDFPEFDLRETRIAHIVLSEVEWLHEESWPDYPVPIVATLRPRLRSILNCLLHGHSRKKIAADFNLSINTVSGYVKEIYRHFSVNSHAELLRRFMDGDGGDQQLRLT